MRTIDEVLDRAKQVQNVRSDYKLALCLGIGGNSLSNYRNGRSFPDEKACAKLAAAIGEKPDLLLVEMQAQRSKDSESRALWAGIAKRLQMGVSSVLLLTVVATISLAATALPALASDKTAASDAPRPYIMLSTGKSLKRPFPLFFNILVKIRKLTLLLCIRGNFSPV